MYYLNTILYILNIKLYSNVLYESVCPTALARARNARCNDHCVPCVPAGLHLSRAAFGLCLRLRLVWSAARAARFCFCHCHCHCPQSAVDRTRRRLRQQTGGRLVATRVRLRSLRVPFQDTSQVRRASPHYSISILQSQFESQALIDCTVVM